MIGRTISALNGTGPHMFSVFTVSPSQQTKGMIYWSAGSKGYRNSIFLLFPAKGFSHSFDHCLPRCLILRHSASRSHSNRSFQLPARGITARLSRFFDATLFLWNSGQPFKAYTLRFTQKCFHILPLVLIRLFHRRHTLLGARKQSWTARFSNTSSNTWFGILIV